MASIPLRCRLIISQYDAAPMPIFTTYFSYRRCRRRQAFAWPDTLYFHIPLTYAMLHTPRPLAMIAATLDIFRDTALCR